VPNAKDTTLPEPPLPQSGRSALSAIPGVALIFSREVVAPVGHPVASPRTIGRDDVADVVVVDPSVSRLHARLEPGTGGLRVSDLGSQNGTFVGGDRVDEPVVAPFGSVLRLGGSLFLVVSDAGAFADVGPPIPGLVGGPGLADVRRRVTAIASSASPVLVEGETGSGKEIVASAVHTLSGRSGELVAVNCAAIASELVESELFGHARGAFSGSQGARAGLFRAADRGTLLLDEIGELEPTAQATLLRALETGEVRGVGEDRGVRVDVRVVAATHRNLSSLVASGDFRADLFHRIAALRIRVPPLREHPEDIPRLCELFLQGQAISLTAPVLESLMQRAWPGNARELRNAVIEAATTARYDGRDALALPDLPVTAAAGDAPGSSERDEPELRGRIDAALAASGGNVGRAATELGLSRSVLYETLRRLRINPAAHRRR
jgi:transcriptional regulator of acetoin/glycerol metabolism